MIVPLSPPPGGLARHVLLVTTPALWPAYPLLPVVRRTRGREELGVVADARGVCGVTGYAATVFLTNVFCLLRTLDRFLALPREVYATADGAIRSLEMVP